MSYLLERDFGPDYQGEPRIPPPDHFAEIFHSSDFRMALTSADSTLAFSLNHDVHPDRLLWLLLVGEHLRSKGKRVLLELPSNAAPLQFLRSSLFLPLAQNVFAFPNDGVLNSPPGPSVALRYYSEYRRVEIGSGLHLNFVPFFEWLQDWVSTCSDIAVFWDMLPAFAHLVVEISRNVVYHSRYTNNGCGYSVLTCEPAAVPPRLSCLIADSGRGLRQSMQAKGFAVHSDMDAISQAVLFRYGNSSEHGGLFRALQLASWLSGVVKIRSGSAFAFLDLKKRPVQTRDRVKQFLESGLKVSSDRNYFPGVQFYVRLNGRASGGSL